VYTTSSVHNTKDILSIHNLVEHPSGELEADINPLAANHGKDTTDSCAECAILHSAKVLLQKKSD
jgi:hypothetical protein